MSTTAPENIIAQQSVIVDIDSVKGYRKNPRVGNLPEIMKSLQKNGQFRPIVVQKSTDEILGGNHTWKAAKELGWKKIQAVFVDVDDEAAKRIVLADNRTNDLATYDAAILQDILSGIPDTTGTGYDDEAVKALLDGMQQQNTQMVDDVLRPPATLPSIDRDIEWGEGDNSVGGGSAPDLGPLDLDQDDLDAPAPDQLKEASDELNGAFGLKIGQVYELTGGMDIPPLIPSMLVKPEDIPRDLLAWAGSATKDWPNENQWWLYNFGIDSTSGMKDISKVIVSFYCWDTYFESWWDFPDRYAAKLLNSGIKMAITPDYSQWTGDPKVVSLHNLYRSRWIGRYLQEAGIKIIPNISWRYGEQDYYDTYVRPTLPKELPVIGIQLQTFDKDQTDAERADLVKFIEHVGATCNADLTIFYVGKQARPIVEAIPWPGEKLILNNRLDALGEQAKGRQKKKTL